MFPLSEALIALSHGTFAEMQMLEDNGPLKYPYFFK